MPDREHRSGPNARRVNAEGGTEDRGTGRTLDERTPWTEDRNGPNAKPANAVDEETDLTLNQRTPDKGQRQADAGQRTEAGGDGNENGREEGEQATAQ